MSVYLILLEDRAGSDLGAELVHVAARRTTQEKSVIYNIYVGIKLSCTIFTFPWRLLINTSSRSIGNIVNIFIMPFVDEPACFKE